MKSGGGEKASCAAVSGPRTEHRSAALQLQAPTVTRARTPFGVRGSARRLAHFLRRSQERAANQRLATHSLKLGGRERLRSGGRAWPGEFLTTRWPEEKPLPRMRLAGIERDSDLRVVIGCALRVL